MRAYTKTILRDVGLLLHVPGVMALISMPACILLGEWYAIPSFLLTAGIGIGLGQLLYRLFYKVSEEAQIRHAMLTVALSWGLIPLIGAIPFLSIASHLATLPQTPQTILEFQQPWNAIFESFSGFTSTGLSVAAHPSELPHCLQWWRSFIEWIGGVGVIVLVLSLLEPASNPYQLYYAEGRSKKIALTVSATVRKIWKIYLLYTVASIILLRVAGMPWWEALNHGLTGISTGGFSVRDDSIGAYNPIIQLATLPIMTVGAISFSMHYNVLIRRQVAQLWKDIQHRTLWILLGIGSVLLAFENLWFNGSFLWLDSIFQWVSALGTCGFNTVDVQTWSPTAKLLLTVAMIFGGASGSTVGGLKLNRVVSLYKGLLWRFQRISLQPHQLLRYRLDDKVLRETEASRRVEAAAVLGVLWLLILLLGTLVLLHLKLPQYTLADVLFEASSALGSVGLSTGITSPDLPWIGKCTLVILMWMGRLEIIPVVILFSAITQHFIHFGRQTQHRKQKK
jgi:trk system potassium uptake protein TrkH